MSDQQARAYAAEAAVWCRLAGLLPETGDREEVQACWDIGEQEAGLELLVGRLLEQGVAVGEVARAEIAVMAEQWGVWDRLGAGIAVCACASRRPARLRVWEDGAEETVPVRAVLPGHPSAGLVLVPWIACVPCGRVLARAHEREEWGELSYLAESYVVFGREHDVPPRVFGRDEHGAAWSALAVLRGSCR